MHFIHLSSSRIENAHKTTKLFECISCSANLTLVLVFGLHVTSILRMLETLVAGRLSHSRSMRNVAYTLWNSKELLDLYSIWKYVFVISISIALMNGGWNLKKKKQSDNNKNSHYKWIIDDISLYS